MPLLQLLLSATAFKSPLLRTLVPSVALAYGIQVAVAVPSIAAKTERYYDLSGSVTYLSVVGASVFLPYLRAREAGMAASLGAYFGGGGGGLWWWRQGLLSAAVGVWAVRLGTHLYHRITTTPSGTDSRFDTIRTSPAKFSIAFFFQATWVTLCTLPLILLNSLPRTAFTLAAPALTLLPKTPYLTDLLGLLLFASGLAFESLADAQKAAWTREKHAKKHDEDFLTRGLWSKSRHPNYFGEVVLWSGIAVAAAGVVVRWPALVALGLGNMGILGGRVLVGAMCAASPAFVAFLLLKVSGVPLSEEKYDALYGDREDYQRWKKETPMLVPKL